LRRQLLLVEESSSASPFDWDPDHDRANGTANCRTTARHDAFDVFAAASDGDRLMLRRWLWIGGERDGTVVDEQEQGADGEQDQQQAERQQQEPETQIFA
jgi:hypothetical protein